MKKRALPVEDNVPTIDVAEVELEHLALCSRLDFTDEEARSTLNRDDSMEVVQAAIAEELPVSFWYERSDGTVTRHNAVYPKVVFQQWHFTLMRAYCHFTRDFRVFRIDRIRSIRIGRRLPYISDRHQFSRVVVALVLVIALFAALFLFSPKYGLRAGIASETAQRLE